MGVNARLSLGSIQLGSRWKTLTSAAHVAASATTCTALDPVPSTPTRRPARSRSSGQAALWQITPEKPGPSRARTGMRGTLRKPTALITAWNGACGRPELVTISYAPRSSAQVTLSTLSFRTR